MNKTLTVFLIFTLTTTKSERNGRILKLLTYNVDYNDQPKEGEEFDFIIVGAGSAGSVLANRLSEHSEWKILLLEAGIPPIEAMDVPALVASFYFSPYNWKYLMERQENMCLGLTDQRMAWPRGKGLGGTSLINYMLHVRGNKHDYDIWAAMGNPGWSYGELLPYFKKSENATFQYQDPEYHGKTGLLTVEDVLYRTKSAEAFVEALQQLGYPYVDYNGHQQIGVSFAQGDLREGRRCSVEKAFLRTAKHRSNLKIIKRAHVTKILIDSTSRTAYGVRFSRDDKIYTAKAGREVVLSAGTFNSPQLLMLSGIGPKDHLEELKIPALHDLPVGQKMYDHLMFAGLLVEVNDSIVFKQGVLFDLRNYRALFEGRSRNPLSSLGGVEAFAYLKLNKSDLNLDYPDMELVFIGGGMHTDYGTIYRRTFRISDKVYYKFWLPYESKNAFQVMPMLLHPISYGHLKLRSKNPFDYPKLYGNYFTDPDNNDIKTFIASIRFVQEVIKTPAFQRYDAKLVTTPIPGCESFDYDSDPYWECALRHISATLHHQVSTCKMGPEDDPEAVVDSRLRVYGIKKLRVADCSIIPRPLSAHTNVPAIMIGEKASDIIKEDYNVL